MEKFMKWFGILFAGSLLLFMNISAFYVTEAGLFSNFYAQNCAGEAWYFKALGILLELAVVKIFVDVANLKYEFSPGIGFLCLALLGGAFCAFAGFTFPVA